MEHPKGSRLRSALTVAVLLVLGGCGGGSVCIPGVPCGPVPSCAEPVPAPVATAQRFAAIGLGHNHSCMRTAAGGAWCWGDGWGGVLGDGVADHRSTPVAVATPWSAAERPQRRPAERPIGAVAQWHTDAVAQLAVMQPTGVCAAARCTGSSTRDPRPQAFGSGCGPDSA